MKFLLDTHVLLWAAGQPERLSAARRRLLNTPSHELGETPSDMDRGMEQFQPEPGGPDRER